MELIQQIFNTPELAIMSAFCIGMGVGALVTVTVFNNDKIA